MRNKLSANYNNPEKIKCLISIKKIITLSEQSEDIRQRLAMIQILVKILK